MKSWGWLAGILGAVRDDDVLLARMRKRAAQLPDEDRSGASRVLVMLETARGRSHEELLSTLRSERYLALLDQLIEAAQAPALLAGVRQGRSSRAGPLVRRPLRTLAKQVSGLANQPADDELHAVRLRTKRARYAEAVAPVLGKQARTVAKAAAELQEVLLGEHQDAVVAEQWLRAWMRGAVQVAGAFAAGELVGLGAGGRRTGTRAMAQGLEEAVSGSTANVDVNRGRARGDSRLAPKHLHDYSRCVAAALVAALKAPGRGKGSRST